ncbi:hypothetical protein AAG570_011972 [Ranatra chinensis]|uniref:Anaphase-promoting complex subunit 5 n=1 Tax=Ranatra chinensis TaxID=642074 RepID=A0ABD0YHQ8_9HEMI
MAIDYWSIRGISKNSLLEYVTPHKICIVILIREFCLIKSYSAKHKMQLKRVLFQEEIKPAFRRDFCMLALHLIQSPDIEYEEFINTLEAGEYKLLPELIANFKQEVEGLLEKDVGSITDVLLNVERFISESTNFDPLINKSSMIGLFLRRVRVFFDKLSFSQTIGMFKAFQNYVSCRKDAILSERKARQINISTCSGKTQVMDMELSSIHDDEDTTLSHITSQVIHSKLKYRSSDGKDDSLVGLWSRRQVELFLAQQAKLLINNPEHAMSPKELQSKIRDVISTNPEHAEAHYLSYLNCLRAKEYCGSVDSLFHFFDRKASNVYEDESAQCKGLRYAALNQAILQAKFNHKSDALCALKEAITLAHEANDNVCLQHAQAWMYKLTNENNDVLIERSVSKSNELNLNYLSSFGLQSYAEFAAKLGGLPSHIFELISKSDVLNCQYSMMDLLALSFAHKAALWSMYGRSDLALLAAQQLLYMSTSCSSKSVTVQSGEPLILAISNIANYFTVQGEYQLAWLLVNHGKERVPDSKWWIWSENVLYFVESLHKGLWQHAQAAVNQLATVDKFESQLRLCQLLLAKDNKRGAWEAANRVLDTAECPMLRIRALHLKAKCNPFGAVMALSDALFISNYHSIDYWMGLIALEMANAQLEMGLPCQAMKLVDRTLLGILSHGCYADMSDSFLLYAKCKVATVATAPFPICAEVTSESIRLLDKAAEYAKQIEDYLRVKKIVYIQVKYFA